VMLGLPASQGQLVGIVVSRSLRPFSAHDRFLLRMLSPHFIQAYRNAEAVSRLRREQARAGEVVDALGIEIMVLGRDARVQSASERAWRWVGDYFAGVPLDEDPRGPNFLPATLDRWVRAEQILRSGDWRAREEHETSTECLAVRQNGKRLVVRLCGDEDERLLVLHEEQHASSDGAQPATFQKSFVLTPREAEVLTWVIHGKTNAEIGSILRIRPRTVAKHLEHVFPRLGVETRTSAIARVLCQDSALAVAPPPFSHASNRGVRRGSGEDNYAGEPR
ncbi:MAG: helix-turn-helix transcriptional regulator, partial [Nitrospirota bacterium]